MWGADPDAAGRPGHLAWRWEANSGGEAVADKLLSEYLLTGRARLAATGPVPHGSCPACGASLAADREPLQQPTAGALLLTSRERTVFRLLGAGYDNRSIARELGISERTVKRYVTAILAKLELESRLQAGLAALIISSSPAGDAYWPKGRIDLPRGDGETIDGLQFQCPGGTMAFDALARLREAGNPVDLLTAGQRNVLAQLTEEEVAVLNSVKARLDAVSDAEVEGQSVSIKIA
jgi:DNA-binding CsgD family transcriptional regulator